ncbi:MAG: monothiol glutaredoxin, Grx4 family, partial [Clostridia bacterium]|nr:monothiol glutaredoxin, Grx4 family [Deltaproteobacteria bacterium]
VNVLDDQGIREGIKTFSDWPTIPQLYVAGEFVGGSDAMRDLHAKGELADLIKKAAAK